MHDRLPNFQFLCVTLIHLNFIQNIENLQGKNANWTVTFGCTDERTADLVW